MTPEQTEQLRPLLEFARERAKAIEMASTQQWAMSAEANADVRRISLFGSAGAIGLLSTRIPTSTSHLTVSSGTAIIAIIFFATAVFFAISGRSAEWAERAQGGLKLQKHARKVYQRYTSPKALEQNLKDGTLAKEPRYPRHLNLCSDKAYAWAYGLMFGGGVASALHLLTPLLVDTWYRAVNIFSGQP